MSHEVQHGRVRAIALAVCFLVVAFSRPAAAQVSIDQVELVLAPRSMTQSTAVFNATNESEKPVQVKITLGDWDRAADGQNRFYDLGTQPQSCAKMVTVFPQTAVLDPHVSQPVRVSLHDADSLRTACWMIVYVETQESGGSPVSGTQITYVIRTGVKVYAEPGGLNRDGVVEDADVTPHLRNPSLATDTATQDIAVDFRNTGGLPLQVHGSVELRRPDNSLAATIPVVEFPVLPGAMRRLALPLPSLPPSRYIALVLLDFGGREIAAGQVDFEAK